MEPRGTEAYQNVARKEEQGHSFYRGSCLYSAQEKDSGKALDSELGVLSSNPSSSTC